MTYTTGATLYVFDERGTLIGTIDRPLSRHPLGPGCATVYLVRAAQLEAHPAEAA